MSAAGMPDVRAVLFDKDGTLFDFARTWNAWSLEVLNHLSGGDEALADALARAIMFDRQAVTFLPGSPAIAGTNDMVARALASELPGADAGQIARFLADSAAGAPLAEAVPLVPLLAQLAARDMALGVMTNDHESSARAHLSASGVLEMFDFVAGADSGVIVDASSARSWSAADAAKKVTPSTANCEVATVCPTVSLSNLPPWTGRTIRATHAL